MPNRAPLIFCLAPKYRVDEASRQMFVFADYNFNQPIIEAVDWPDSPLHTPKARQYFLGDPEILSQDELSCKIGVSIKLIATRENTAVQSGWGTRTTMNGAYKILYSNSMKNLQMAVQLGFVDTYVKIFTKSEDI